MNNIIELDSSRAGRYLTEAINGFLGDPPDSDYQAGFLAALVVVAKEGLGRSEDARVKAAERVSEQYRLLSPTD